MSYAQKKEISGNRTAAIVVVALIHALLGYAIVTGLAFNVVKKVAEDLKTFDVEEEPPPPEEEPPPPRDEVVTVRPEAAEDRHRFALPAGLVEREQFVDGGQRWSVTASAGVHTLVAYHPSQPQYRHSVRFQAQPLTVRAIARVSGYFTIRC